MIGKFNEKRSWENQSVYDLDNGWQATLSYSTCYGEFVSRLDSPDRKTYWHCSNGVKDLPEFARSWLKGGDFHTTANMVLVKFEKRFDN